MRSLITIIIGLILIALTFSCQSDEQIEFNRYYSAGTAIYQAHCENCHGEKGEGLQSLIPPLTDSTYLKNNRTLLTCYLKNGIKGSLTVHGRGFEGEMPASDLSPIEIAKVLTYVTNSFGNKMGLINLQEVQNSIEKCK
ncbi:c-type cytochrome [Mucilaginibacter aquaedulcis]|uniref:c-type cytochrome n=1 Tax=Mucilaginibacter aquaedulcis TaxID=1187081 RepID=UPI0025B59DE3|nr:cytochrome c [Mucilaginibacter aquaedulcis]MDN3547937.1 cytochrome c [Mucilaginibacter aquaedulcis]